MKLSININIFDASRSVWILSNQFFMRFMILEVTLYFHQWYFLCFATRCMFVCYI